MKPVPFANLTLKNGVKGRHIDQDGVRQMDPWV